MTEELDVAAQLLRRWEELEPRIRPVRSDGYLEAWLRNLGDTRAELVGVVPEARRSFCLSVISSRLLALQAVDDDGEWVRNPLGSAHRMLSAMETADDAARSWRARWKPWILAEA